jgi:hypothetical protein
MNFAVAALHYILRPNFTFILPSMVQIEYKLTEKEVYQGLVQNNSTRLITRILRGLGIFLLVVMVFTTTINIVNGINYFSMSYLFPMLMAVYLTFLSEITAKIQVPNLIKTKNPYVQLVRVRMDGNGFRMKGESFSNFMEWEKFHSIVETADFFLVKPTEAAANIMPKRAFTTEDIAEFKNLMEGVSGPKIKWKQ